MKFRTSDFCEPYFPINLKATRKLLPFDPALLIMRIIIKTQTYTNSLKFPKTPDKRLIRTPGKSRLIKICKCTFPSCIIPRTAGSHTHTHTRMCVCPLFYKAPSESMLYPHLSKYLAPHSRRPRLEQQKQAMPMSVGIPSPLWVAPFHFCIPLRWLLPFSSPSSVLLISLSHDSAIWWRSFIVKSISKVGPFFFLFLSLFLLSRFQSMSVWLQWIKIALC